jgi:hypothetical protein
MSQSFAPRRLRPLRWLLPLLMALGLSVAGLPVAASAASTGTISGTVTYHESSPDRTLQVFRGTSDGQWAADPALQTTVADDGSYSVQVPAGEAVKLRVSYGDPAYGYWYDDAFDQETAASVSVDAGHTVSADFDVPAPSYVSGRLVDRSGNPVAGMVVPSINNDGSLRPIVDAPIPVDATGEYSVILPADHEDSVLGLNETGDTYVWLLGGSGYEPNWYTNTTAGQTLTGQDITLPLGAAPIPDEHASETAKLRATHSPVVRGAARKGALLRSTRGVFNLRPTTVRYQWLRNGKAIHGATRATYRLRKADVRKRVSVRVTAYRTGAHVRATSARTRLVRAH